MRASPGGGEQRVKCRDMLTLQQGKWLNDNIINFVRKVFIQLRRGRGAARTYMFSSHLMDKLLSGPDPEDPNNFPVVT